MLFHAAVPPSVRRTHPGSCLDGRAKCCTSVIAVFQVVGQVLSLCRTYYLNVKDARKNIERLRNEVTALENVLAELVDLKIAPDLTNTSVLGRLNQKDGPIQQCKADLVAIADKLKVDSGKRRMKLYGMRTLEWPFSAKEVEKFIVSIKRHKASFNLGLSLDLMYVPLFLFAIQFLLTAASGLSRAIKSGMADLQTDISKSAQGIARLELG